MAKDCLYCCGCLVVVLLNISFLLIGLVLMAAGGVIMGGGELVKNMINIDLSSFLPGVDIGVILNDAVAELAGIATALLIMGLIVFVLSLLGMCGACCKSKIVLIIYVIILGVLILGQIILISIYFGNKALFEEQAKTYLKQTITDKYKGDNSKDFISLAWGMMNLFLQCCGVENGEDFKEAKEWTEKSAEYNNNKYALQYPLSCCKAASAPNIDDPQLCATNPQLYSNKDTGCYTKLDKEVGKYIVLLGYAVGGICGAQVVLLLIVVFMILCLKKDNSVK